MNITLETQDLTYATTLAQQVSKENSPVPIISNMIFRASKEDGISLYASDLEVMLKIKVQGDINEPGEVSLPAKRFLNIVQNLSNDYPVHIIGQRNNRCLIKSGKGQYRLAGDSIDQFPEMLEYDPNKEDQEVMTLDAHQFRMGIDQTVFATSLDSNEILNSVHFNFSENGAEGGGAEKLEVVATDRFCLSLVNIIPENSAGINGKQLTLSQASVKHLRKTFATSFTITVMIEQSQALFTDNINTLTTRLVAGSYINYNGIVAPDTCTGQAIIPRRTIIEAIRRINVISTLKKGNVMLLRFDPNTEDGGQLKLSAAAAERGDGEEILQVDGLNGECEIAVNSENILKTLNAMRSDTIKFRFSETERPLYLEAIGDDLQNEHTCLIMPVKLT